MFIGHPPPRPPPPRLPAPAPAEQEAVNWNCSECTYANHPALDRCEICEYPRTKKPPQAVGQWRMRVGICVTDATIWILPKTVLYVVVLCHCFYSISVFCRFWLKEFSFVYPHCACASRHERWHSACTPITWRKIATVAMELCHKMNVCLSLPRVARLKYVWPPVLRRIYIITSAVPDLYHFSRFNKVRKLIVFVTLVCSKSNSCVRIFSQNKTYNLAVTVRTVE